MVQVLQKKRKNGKEGKGRRKGKEWSRRGGKRRGDMNYNFFFFEYDLHITNISVD